MRRDTRSHSINSTNLFIRRKRDKKRVKRRVKTRKSLSIWIITWFNKDKII